MRTVDEIVEETRSLTVADRLRVVERIVREVACAAIPEPPPRPKVAPLGWLADQPDVADQLEKLTAEVRALGRARGLGDEDGD